jgi:hypothetical protein
MNSYFIEAEAWLVNLIIDCLAWENHPRAEASNPSRKLFQISSWRFAISTAWSLPSILWQRYRYPNPPRTYRMTAGSYARNIKSLVSPKLRGNTTISSADTSHSSVPNLNWYTSRKDHDDAVTSPTPSRATFGTKATSRVVLSVIYTQPTRLFALEYRSHRYPPNRKSR